MKKKDRNILIGVGSGIAALLAGVVAFKNKDKIKNKVNSLKSKKKNK